MTDSADAGGSPSLDTYALAAKEAKPMPAPALPYGPPMPRDRSIAIGLVGAGGISAAHLQAYARYGLRVVAICDRHLDRAQARRDAYYPEAAATDRLEDVIGRTDTPVLDLTVHPADRVAMIRAALAAGQHVLSQKPFVDDLAVGHELVDLAAARGLQLAVNQNGRWAPHLSWMREAVGAGLVGDVVAVHVSIQWDHGWIEGTRFDSMPFVILQDFAIHWFDFLVSIIGDRAEQVFATASRAHGQKIQPGLLAQVHVTFPGGQASLAFDGSTPYGPTDATVVVGTRGTLRSTGPDLSHQEVALTTAEGIARPALSGEWFCEGFAGTMGALLCAVETRQEPIHSARGNLAALRLCHAAIDSVKACAPIRLR